MVMEVYEQLKGLGVSLRIEHGRLVAAAPKGVVTDAVRSLIAEHKQALLEHIGGLASAPRAALSIMPGARDDIIPLSQGQEGLLFLDELDGGSTNYNMVAALRITGGLDIEAMRLTLETIVARQEALRIRVLRQQDGARQFAVPPGHFTLAVISVTPDEVADEVRRETERPFDLGAGALFRARLLRLGALEHVLIISMHHLIGDGWSLGILAQEISSIYPAVAAEGTNPLPPLEVGYLDFVHWMRGKLEAGLLDEQLAFWKANLAGAPAVLDLAPDRVRPARRSNRGSVESLVIGQDLLSAVQTHARSEGATLFVYLLAAFNLLAARYSGQEEIVVGTPVANRSYTEVETVIGFFVNTIALRNRVSGAITVGELLRNVKASTLAALRNSDVSFPQLVEQLAPERGLSHSPIFQVNFGLQNTPTSELSLGDLELTPIEFKTESTKFDLTVNAAVENDELIVSAEYSTDLYEPETIRLLLADYRSLLEAMVGRSHLPISRIEIRSLDERMRLLSSAGPNMPLVASNALEMLGTAARQFSARIAVQHGAQSIGYAELESRSDRLAALLAGLGCAPDRVVGVLAKPSIDFVVAAIAIMKSGAAYLPLDPASPDHRLLAILADASPLLVLTDSDEAVGARLSGYSVRALDALVSEARAQKPGRTLVAPQPADVAYMIYTSGSTGIPKGVELTHGGLANLIANLVEAMELTPGDHVLQFTPTTFDVSVQEIFSTLAAGARLILPDTYAKVGDPLLQLMRDQAVTVATLPPSVLTSTRPERLPHLRLVVSGAEAISADVVDEWGRGRKFYYNYGPTEATVTATAKFCRPGEERPTIGRPLANVRVHIVDRHLATVPVNVVGEVMIGGVGLARGYVRNPALTADSFIPDPFSTAPGARLYRTGDLARFRSDGEFQFVGRADSQVKLRGFRIELGEVEAALRSHPAVLDAVALVAEDGAGQDRLIGYVRVDEPDAEELIDRIRGHLRGVVPHYMIPSIVVPLSQFPLNTNGKIDKSALPPPFVSASPSAPSPEGGVLESGIASVFATVIGVDEVRLDDNFFEVGGESLLAIQAVSRINDHFGIELNVADVFEYSTPRALAARICATQDDLARLVEELESVSEADACALVNV